jgi:acetyl-CoA acyltransferase
MIRDAVIVDAVRTPIGTTTIVALGIHPADLSALTLEALVQRAGIDPALVDDVIPRAA